MEQTFRGGKRIAFFGGSFDPPHLGHLAIARAARAALDLDTVLFAPVGAQPLKMHGSSASFQDRLAMTRLAIAGEPAFAVSLADAPKPTGAPNYTIDTLHALRAGLPSDGELFCLMGADSFLGLRQWYRSAEIPFLASLIVASRPGQPLNDLRPLLPQGLEFSPGREVREAGDGVVVRSGMLHNDAGESASIYILDGLQIEISASQIRGRSREQACLTGEITRVEEPSPEELLLPGAVREWIETRGLYR